MKKRTVVLGASNNPHRYSYTACQMLHERGLDFIPISIKNGEIFGREILQLTDKPFIENVGTITIYMNHVHQKNWHDYILGLKPERLIFNPGAENMELQKLAREKGISTENSCTLVLLSTGQF